MTIEFDTSDLDPYLTDQTLESEVGVWFKFAPGRRIRCLRAGGSNSRFTRMVSSVVRSSKRRMDRGLMDDEEQDARMREIYAKTVVTGWEGINDKQGNAVPFTPENVAAYFKAFPEIFNDIVQFAGAMENFLVSHIEEAKEALGKP